MPYPAGGRLERSMKSFASKKVLIKPSAQRSNPLLVLFLAVLVLFLSTGPAQNLKPSQLLLYNVHDNLLLQVTFEYDQQGNNISRTVYDRVGFLIRRTALEPVEGRIVRADYLDDNGDLKTRAAYDYSGTTKTVSISSEFNLPLFQTSYDTSPTDNYTLPGVGSMAYEYDSNNHISRINVSDQTGNPTNYALVEYGIPSGLKQPPAQPAAIITSIRRLNPAKVQFIISLEKARSVRADLYSLKGNLVKILADQRLEQGEHALVFDIGSDKSIRSKGMYILKFGLGDKQNTFKMKLIK
jgi:YD repeat-containing protein